MSVSVYDHLRPIDADIPDGVYRVVGTATNEVVLLRVGDPDGRRVNTGAVVAVDRDALDGFDAVDNPDGNRSVGSIVTSLLRTIYWQFRAFVASLIDHPVAAAVALAIVLFGLFGEGVTALHDEILGLGVIVLAFVGSGRLS